MHGGVRRMRLYRVKLASSYPDGIRRCAVEDQLPLLQDPWRVHVPISCINDLQSPSTVSFFTPEVHAEEGPVVEV